MSAQHADVLVIGAGQAAFELARSLRKEGFTGSVLVLGDEQHLPYDRPPLSKGLFKGGADVDRLAFLGAPGYAKLDVVLRLGVRVTMLNPAEHSVTTDDGDTIGYGACVVATGARAVPSPWTSTQRVHSIRTVADAQRLAHAVSGGAKRVVVIGGGFLGLETASTMVDAGCTVDLVEAGPQLLAGRTSAFTSRWLLERHTERGLTIHLGCSVVELAEEREDVRVRLADGSEVLVDEVVFAVGALPNLELAREAGAECGRAIFVDAQCRTSLDDVFAIGDVASARSASGSEVRVESVYNAKAQARIVASVLTGTQGRDQGVPTFWSDQAGISLRMAGWVPPGIDTTDVVLEEEDGWLVERYLGGGLVAIESVNRLAELLKAQRSINDLRVRL